MAIIKIHGQPLSTNSISVIACLYEKGLDFDLVRVSMSSGAHKQQPFLSLNPFGQVPAFEDGDLKLFESRAINDYIARAYAKQGNDLIYQDDIKKSAIMAVWSSVEAHQYAPPAAKLTWEVFYKPLFGRVPDQALIEELEVQLAKVLDIYEARLTESKYLGGDKFTLADLNHLPSIGFLMENPRAASLFNSRPHVSAWCADIQARPAWQKALNTRNSNSI